MDAACRRFRRGNVAIIGSDIPDANAADLRAAFRALGRHDAVFGPAEDGGYWLVALGPRRPAQPFVNADGLPSTRWPIRCGTSAAIASRDCGCCATLIPLCDLPRIRDDSG